MLHDAQCLAMYVAALVVNGPAVCGAAVRMGQSTSGPESQEPPEVSMHPASSDLPTFTLVHQHTIGWHSLVL